MVHSGPVAPAKIRDATKHKAVSQRVDYETFKNMVSVAHLKPLHSPSAVAQGDRSGAPAWQLGLDGPEAEQRTGNGATGVTMPEAPASGADFERAWRRGRSEAHRVSYLLQIPPPQYRLLFKVEVSPAILADLLMLYALHWRAFGATEQEAALHVCHSLASLSETGRFALAVGLLNARVKAAAADLFDALDAATVGETVPIQGTCAAVRTRFGV